LKDRYETLGVERSASPDAITVSLKFNRLFAETKGSCTQGPHFGAVRTKPRNPTSGMFAIWPFPSPIARAVFDRQRRFHLPGVVSVSNGPPFGSLPISRVFCLDHDSLACKNAPMRAIAARASGRMRANICQTWNMRGHAWSSTSQPIARRRSAIRTASSRSASSLPT